MQDFIATLFGDMFGPDGRERMQQLTDAAKCLTAVPIYCDDCGAEVARVKRPTWVVAARCGRCMDVE